MANKKDIFSKDIEVPEIVMHKAEDAFAQIRLGEKNSMTESNKNDAKNQGKQRTIFKNHAAVAACIGILAISSVTAVAAAYYHFWGRGMQGNLQASKEQQQELIEQGYATVMEEEENYEELAVTVGNVTVKPVTVITDGKFAYLSFAVDGYSIGDNIEPAFESVKVYLDDNPDSWLNMSGSFYNGIVSDETGSPIYDNGEPLAFDENGNLITHYADENGILEYVIMVYTANLDENLLGRTLHVDFTNLGNVYKTDYTGDLEGKWNFEINLSGESAAKKVSVGKVVEDTAFTVDSIEISPVSIKVNYSVNGEVMISSGENGVPDFCGVILKDGTRLPYLGDGGTSGYTDENRTNAYVMSAFDRVIEPEQVKAILLRLEAGTDYAIVELETNIGE